MHLIAGNEMDADTFGEVTSAGLWIYELVWRFDLNFTFLSSKLKSDDACLICRLKTSEQTARNGSRTVKHHLVAPSAKSSMLSRFCDVDLYINMYCLRYIPLFIQLSISLAKKKKSLALSE